MKQRTASTILVILIAFTCVACTRTSRLRMTAHSMEPTLPDGTMVSYHEATAAPTRGQLVVAQISNRLSVSRVVALPGETVEIRGGVLIVGGRAGTDPHPGDPIRYTMPPVHLSADQYFVLGDNRNDAVDSHIYGPVSRSLLRGIINR